MLSTAYGSLSVLMFYMIEICVGHNRPCSCLCKAFVKVITSDRRCPNEQRGSAISYSFCNFIRITNIPFVPQKPHSILLSTLNVITNLFPLLRMETHFCTTGPCLRISNKKQSTCNTHEAAHATNTGSQREQGLSHSKSRTQKATTDFLGQYSETLAHQ